MHEHKSENNDCNILQAALLLHGQDSSSSEEGEEEAAAAPEAATAALPKRVSRKRVVYVNGDPVLKANLYDIEKGESGVRDQEMASGSGECMQEGVGGLNIRD